MGLGRLRADHQPLSDLLVVEAVAHQRQHLPFAGRQRAEGLSIQAAEPVELGCPQIAVDVGRTQIHTGEGLQHRAHADVALEAEAITAALQGLLNQRGPPRLGHDQQRAQLGPDLLGRRHQAAAVSLLELVGAEQQIRLMLIQPLQGGRLAGDSPHKLRARSDGADKQAQGQAAAHGRHQARVLQEAIAGLGVAAHLRHQIGEVHASRVAVPLCAEPRALAALPAGYVDPHSQGRWRFSTIVWSCRPLPAMAFFDSEIVQEDAKRLFGDYQQLMQLGGEYGKFDREGKKLFIERMEALMDRYRVFMKRFELSEDFQAKLTVEQLRTQLGQFGLTPEQMFEQMQRTLERMKLELEKQG